MRISLEHVHCSV